MELNVILLSLHAFLRDVELTDKREKDYMFMTNGIAMNSITMNSIERQKKKE